MYESSQQLVGALLALSAIVAAGAFIASLFSAPRYPETATNGDTTRIGNEKDKSDAAIETRARVAAGWTADGSADYTPGQRFDTFA